METKALKFLGGTALALAMAAGLSVSPATAATQNVRVFQAFQSVMYLPLYVAIDEGIFQKNGLNVEKITAGSGAAGVAAVIGGHADFSLQDPMTAVLADKRGASVVSVAMVVNGVPVWIVVPKNSSVQNISELAGKTISTALPPSTSTYLLERLLKQEKLSSISLDTVQEGTELAPVEAGRAAAAALYEPQADEGIASGYRIIYPFTAQYPGGYEFSTMDTLASTIKNNPRMVQSFVTAMNQAEALIQKSPSTAIAVAEKEFPTLPKAVVDTAVKRLISDQVYPENTNISPQAFHNALALQEYIGNLKYGSETYHGNVDDSFSKVATANQ